MKPARPLAAGLLALAASLLLAGPASATFHEMSIREVYPGSLALPESEYVELQMWAPGQNMVEGHSLKTYKANGTLSGTTTFAGDVPAAANQSTILLATPAAESQFGVVPDAAMVPGQLDPGGGAACWAESIDCVSWGNFSGALPSPAGLPAAPSGIPDGMALRRTIAPGCATLLEPTDDRDNSAIDFSAVFPAPRPNSVAPSEHFCASSGGQSEGANGQGARGAPQTTLKRKPPHKTHDHTPTFRLGSDEPGSTFQCKLDGKPYRSCRSPFTSKALSTGTHTFKVRARDNSGRLDPSPAICIFRIVA
ncbi:MAG TPA: hypothetical protein VHU14_00045 [Solirubrobacterales bacterium]|jgi:hypothetical protein|nr:hypothetical protein [Solirubrobacterales bacterium]